jgi:small-conductance mechanosensitive channel
LDRGWRRRIVPNAVTPCAACTVATSHPKALAERAPLALCTGFGDRALKLQSLLSELALGVHRALSAAKIEIPNPQRDVHIRNGDAGTPRGRPHFAN